MIAKLIVHAPGRAAAAARLAQAAAEVQVWPVKTNAGFLVHCLSHPDFVGGDVDTSFIPEPLGRPGPFGGAAGGGAAGRRPRPASGRAVRGRRAARQACKVSASTPIGRWAARVQLAGAERGGRHRLGRAPRSADPARRRPDHRLRQGPGLRLRACAGPRRRRRGQRRRGGAVAHARAHRLRGGQAGATPWPRARRWSPSKR